MSDKGAKDHKVLVSGSIDPDVFELLQAHCRAHPRLSRSAVMSRALRQLLSPEHQEERERVLTDNLDRLYWRLHNHADRVDGDLRLVKEMLTLFVRTFYNHVPELPPEVREAAAMQGERRLRRFMEVLAENVGTGKSRLERMPEEAPPEDVTPHDTITPDADPDEEASDAFRH